MLRSLCICSLLLTSATSVFASSIEEINDTADSMYYFSKYCADEFHKLKVSSPDAWIGTMERWSNVNGSFGYNYHVLHAPNYFTTQQLGTILLTVKPIANPPADGSSYSFSCIKQ